VVRHNRIGADSISLDEMWHLGLSTGRGSPQMVWPVNEVISVERSWTEIDSAPPWYACWANMERVLHPPLFVTSLRLWREGFGSSDVAAQWYTAVWSLVTILLVFEIVRAVGGSAPAGLWAGATLAVAPTQILLSQELRAYSMLAGLTCVAMLAAARMDSHGVTPRRAIALGAAMLAMMLTHYFAVGVCALIALWACMRFRGRNLGLLWVVFAGAGLAFCVTWLPIALQQIPDIGHTADPWLKEPGDRPYLLAVARFFAMPIRLFVDQLPSRPLTDHEYSAFLWPAIGLTFLMLVTWRAIKQPNLRLPLLWFAGVCGFLLALDLARTTRHLVYIRYSLAAGPAVVVMLILLARQRKGIAVHFVGAAVVLLLLLLNEKAFFEDEPDYRPLRRFMVSQAMPTEPMVFYSGPAVKGYFNEILMLAASREPSLWPRHIVKLAEPATPRLIHSLGGGTAWVFSGPVDDMATLMPGCEVLRSEIIIDSKDRPVAVCTQLKLP